MRIENMPDAVRGQVQLYYRLPSQAAVQAPRRVQAVQQSPSSTDGTQKVGTAPPDDSITLDLSAEGREAARKAALEQQQADKASDPEPEDAEAKAAEHKPREAERNQTPPDKREVEELLQQDRAARAREQTMRAAAGSMPVGAASYAYKVGPDGRLYVVESSVNFDLTDVPGDPEATLRKAEQIRKAALAPAERSPQDRATAAMAAAMATRARHQIHQQQQVKNKAR